MPEFVTVVSFPEAHIPGHLDKSFLRYCLFVARINPEIGYLDHFRSIVSDTVYMLKPCSMEHYSQTYYQGGL